jgi:hypothetical protein
MMNKKYLNIKGFLGNQFYLIKGHIRNKLIMYYLQTIILKNTFSKFFFLKNQKIDEQNHHLFKLSLKFSFLK